MSGPGLEPVAVQQQWHLPGPQPGSAWQQILTGYVRELARACAAQNTGSGHPPIIGHIKLLVLFPERGYLRVSAVDATHPPTCTGQAPDGLDTLSLTLNVLVYDLAHEVLEKLTQDTAAVVAETHAGRVTIDDVGAMGTAGSGGSASDDPGHHAHHHHAG